MTTDANNAAAKSRRNLAKDDVSNVISGLITALIKTDNAMFDLVKYFVTNDANWDHANLKQYVMGTDEVRKDKRNLFLMHSNDYAKIMTSMARLKDGATAGNTSIKADLAAETKRFNALHVRTHDCLTAAYYIRDKMKSSAKAMLDIDDKRKLFLMAGTKDKDGNPEQLSLSASVAAGKGKTVVKAATGTVTRGAGNVSEAAKAEMAMVDTLERIIKTVQFSIDNKKSPTDNNVTGVLWQALFSKLAMAMTFRNGESRIDIKSLVTEENIKAGIDNLAAYNQTKDADEKAKAKAKAATK